MAWAQPTTRCAGGWFSAAPYVGNERSQHTLDMIKKKAEQD